MSASADSPDLKAETLDASSLSNLMLDDDDVIKQQQQQDEEEDQARTTTVTVKEKEEELLKSDAAACTEVVITTTTTTTTLVKEEEQEELIPITVVKEDEPKPPPPEEEEEEEEIKTLVVKEEENQDSTQVTVEQVVVDGWGGEEIIKEQLKYDDGWGEDVSTTVTRVEDVNNPTLEQEEEVGEEFPFPVKPNAVDCSYYVKTGTCQYGLHCKFNHPPDKLRTKKALKDKITGTPSESIGQIECKYYSTSGGCKYGNACRYIHREKTEVSLDLNFLGLPMRPGERECPYYMRTGGCKYSNNCRFHHPDPIAVSGHDPLTGYQNGGPPQQHAAPAQVPMSSWPLQRTPNEQVSFLDSSPSYVPGIYLPPQGYHPNPEWSGYQAPVNPLYPTEINMQHLSLASAMTDTRRKANGCAIQKKAQVGEYPERPGQQECQYFMKTGSCKFKSACRFHHPKSCIPKSSGTILSPVGLPLRPDQPVCTHYSRHRICKYGYSCRYNHPMDCGVSASPAASTVSRQNMSCSDGITETQQEVKMEGGSDAAIRESEW